MHVGTAEGIKGFDRRKRVYSDKAKIPTVCQSHPAKITSDLKYWRKLTPVECERLQGLPDNYTEGVSNSQRYKMLGNGFTAPVISHILKEVAWQS